MHLQRRQRGCSVFHVKPGGLGRRTVDRYASPGKAHFEKMLSVTLTFEPMTLKMSSRHVDLLTSAGSLTVISFIKISQRMHEKMPPRVLIRPYVVSL